MATNLFSSFQIHLFHKCSLFCSCCCCCCCDFIVHAFSLMHNGFDFEATDSSLGSNVKWFALRFSHTFFFLVSSFALRLSPFNSFPSARSLPVFGWPIFVCVCSLYSVLFYLLCTFVLFIVAISPIRKWYQNSKMLMETNNSFKVNIKCSTKFLMKHLYGGLILSLKKIELLSPSECNAREEEENECSIFMRRTRHSTIIWITWYDMEHQRVRVCCLCLGRFSTHFQVILKFRSVHYNCWLDLNRFFFGCCSVDSSLMFPFDSNANHLFQSDRSRSLFRYAVCRGVFWKLVTASLINIDVLIGLFNFWLVEEDFW